MLTAYLKVADLKKLLKDRSLSTTGTKADLVKRLQEADAGWCHVEYITRFNNPHTAGIDFSRQNLMTKVDVGINIFLMAGNP